jgi:hypothetical protein
MSGATLVIFRLSGRVVSMAGGESTVDPPLESSCKSGDTTRRAVGSEAIGCLADEGAAVRRIARGLAEVPRAAGSRGSRDI